MISSCHSLKENTKKTVLSASRKVMWLGHYETFFFLWLRVAASLTVDWGWGCEYIDNWKKLITGRRGWTTTNAISSHTSLHSSLRLMALSMKPHWAFQCEVQAAEVRCFYGFQIMMTSRVLILSVQLLTLRWCQGEHSFRDILSLSSLTHTSKLLR